MGVSNIITFDAHDPRVQNAIPRSGFDNVRTSYQMIKALIREYPDITFDPAKTMIISPDEGGMGRAMYYSSVLGIELGMFYKRRNYTIIVDGRNPIEAHEFLGKSVQDKDVIIVDDMISSGDSVIDVAKQLKGRGARRIFVFATFGLFCNGCDKLNEAYNNGLIDKIFTTNLNYRPEEIINSPWYAEVNMCKYVSYIIDRLNRDESMSELLNPVKKIHDFVDAVRDKK
jgi:ribose-phosphate pyrophosphokinase